MIDFNTFQLKSFSDLLYSMRNYKSTGDNLRYFKVGELVEKGLAAFSNGLLIRVNLPGVDLIGPNGTTYESKVTGLTNKTQNYNAVRGLILKNRRAAKKYDDKLADYFIITDIMQGKACCIPSSKFYDFNDNGANLTAKADPESSDFFLTGYGRTNQSRDYFKESEDFDQSFIRSF